jgi:hypothetical protein
MKEDPTMTYLTQQEAQEIDAELMGPKYGYTLAQASSQNRAFLVVVAGQGGSRLKMLTIIHWRLV